MKALETIDPIPLALDPRDVAARLRFDPGRGGLESLDELVALAQSLIHMRAAYGIARIGARGERTVEVAGVTLASRVLRKCLGATHCAFPFIITLGPELERAAGAQGEIIKQYYLEGMADVALERGAGWLVGELEARYGVSRLAAMSPGSHGDWPITEQAKLFSIFGDTERLIGVRLTDDMLMVPRKSISGILFPSEEGFTACQFCSREPCPSRKAAPAGP